MMTAHDAAIAVGYGDRPPARQLRLISWKPVLRGAYAEVLRWRDRELSDRFSQAVVALVRQAHPDDLAE